MDIICSLTPLKMFSLPCTISNSFLLLPFCLLVGLSFMLELFLKYLVILDCLLLFKSGSPESWFGLCQHSSGCSKVKTSDRTSSVPWGSLPHYPSNIFRFFLLVRTDFIENNLPSFYLKTLGLATISSYLLNNLDDFLTFLRHNTFFLFFPLPILLLHIDIPL